MSMCVIYYKTLTQICLDYYYARWNLGLMEMKGRKSISKDQCVFAGAAPNFFVWGQTSRRSINQVSATTQSLLYDAPSLWCYLIC